MLIKHSTLMVQEETTAYVQSNSMESTQNNVDTIKNIQRGTHRPTTNLYSGHFNDDSLVVFKI